jgi:hydrogenase expression/formation protein HypC
MCLGIPGRVVGMMAGSSDQLALVDVLGTQRPINVGMLDAPEVRAGDWLLIHMGFALERIDEDGAKRAMAGLELLGRPGGDALGPAGTGGRGA